VPCGAINERADVFADTEVQAREMAVAVPHPLNDMLRLVTSPIKPSATPPQAVRAPPLLGQRTQGVMTDLGLDDTERARLRAHGAD
jgi:crotonobetainyl-CoA:carnitine CoA-transferase CaiB-like acyl-CoA transferase